MVRWGVFGGVFLAVALACGGGGLGGSAVGPYAASMAEHMEAENPDIPCPTYNLGDEIDIGDFTVRFDEVSIRPPETELPWITNLDERRHFSQDGVQALVVLYAIRNNAPVATERDVWFPIYGTDGEKGWWGPYNAKLVEEELGITDDTRGALPPGEWLRGVGVVTMRPEHADGAVAHLMREEEQYDPTDPRGRRKIDVLLEQAIVDLGTPAPGPHINPEKR